MKQEKHDRRSRRTRHLVQSALIELLQEKRYEAITVRDILERSGVGSSTFYAHYFDKEDVQAALLKQMLEELSQPMAHNAVEQALLPSLALFRHIQEHASQFRALVRGHAGERVWEVFQTTLSRSIEQALERTYSQKRAPSIPPAVVAQYLAGAFLNLLTWWIEAELPYSPERIDEIFRQLALPGVWTTIERKSE
ncbi:TetR family transcriptional regulator [Reticulibacter mediterranei]|uniref:TetR family transcriptional regulator n=1 Tax=Reticulibacter mediterranei TaxID=2778369 RepID=A0A8J3N435_9CHLR|nr:TetR/AcrR family transcriptional regulator [Reticulibacter mediterranei]GHO93692.1 TetR family transcriptional regulator [Reticulibacter mediterranei]